MFEEQFVADDVSVKNIVMEGEDAREKKGRSGRMSPRVKCGCDEYPHPDSRPPSRQRRFYPDASRNTMTPEPMEGVTPDDFVSRVTSRLLRPPIGRAASLPEDAKTSSSLSSRPPSSHKSSPRRTHSLHAPHTRSSRRRRSLSGTDVDPGSFRLYGPLVIPDIDPGVLRNNEPLIIPNLDSGGRRVNTPLSFRQASPKPPLQVRFDPMMSHERSRSPPSLPEGREQHPPMRREGPLRVGKQREYHQSSLPDIRGINQPPVKVSITPPAKVSVTPPATIFRPQPRRIVEMVSPGEILASIRRSNKPAEESMEIIEPHFLETSTVDIKPIDILLPISQSEFKPVHTRLVNPLSRGMPHFHPSPDVSRTSPKLHHPPSPDIEMLDVAAMEAEAAFSEIPPKTEKLSSAIANKFSEMKQAVSNLFPAPSEKRKREPISMSFEDDDEEELVKLFPTVDTYIPARTTLQQSPVNVDQKLIPELHLIAPPTSDLLNVSTTSNYDPIMDRSTLPKVKRIRSAVPSANVTMEEFDVSFTRMSPTSQKPLDVSVASQSYKIVEDIDPRDILASYQQTSMEVKQTAPSTAQMADRTIEDISPTEILASIKGNVTTLERSPSKSPAVFSPLQSLMSHFHHPKPSPTCSPPSPPNVSGNIYSPTVDTSIKAPDVVTMKDSGPMLKEATKAEDILSAETHNVETVGKFSHSPTLFPPLQSLMSHIHRPKPSPPVALDNLPVPLSKIDLPEQLSDLSMAGIDKSLDRKIEYISTNVTMEQDNIETLEQHPSRSPTLFSPLQSFMSHILHPKPSPPVSQNVSLQDTSLLTDSPLPPTDETSQGQKRLELTAHRITGMMDEEIIPQPTIEKPPSHLSSAFAPLQTLWTHIRRPKSPPPLLQEDESSYLPSETPPPPRVVQSLPIKTIVTSAVDIPAESKYSSIYSNLPSVRAPSPYKYSLPLTTSVKSSISSNILPDEIPLSSIISTPLSGDLPSDIPVQIPLSSTMSTRIPVKKPSSPVLDSQPSPSTVYLPLSLTSKDIPSQPSTSVDYFTPADVEFQQITIAEQTKIMDRTIEDISPEDILSSLRHHQARSSPSPPHQIKHVESIPPEDILSSLKSSQTRNPPSPPPRIKHVETIPPEDILSSLHSSQTRYSPSPPPRIKHVESIPPEDILSSLHSRRARNTPSPPPQIRLVQMVHPEEILSSLIRRQTRSSPSPPPQIRHVEVIDPQRFLASLSHDREVADQSYVSPFEEMEAIDKQEIGSDEIHPSSRASMKQVKDEYEEIIKPDEHYDPIMDRAPIPKTKKVRAAYTSPGPTLDEEDFANSISESRPSSYITSERPSSRLEEDMGPQDKLYDVSQEEYVATKRADRTIEDIDPDDILSSLSGTSSLLHDTSRYHVPVVSTPQPQVAELSRIVTRIEIHAEVVLDKIPAERTRVESRFGRRRRSSSSSPARTKVKRLERHAHFYPEVQRHHVVEDASNEPRRWSDGHRSKRGRKIRFAPGVARHPLRVSSPETSDSENERMRSTKMRYSDHIYEPINPPDIQGPERLGPPLASEEEGPPSPQGTSPSPPASPVSPGSNQSEVDSESFDRRFIRIPLDSEIVVTDAEEGQQEWDDDESGCGASSAPLHPLDPCGSSASPLLQADTISSVAPPAQWSTNQGEDGGQTTRPPSSPSFRDDYPPPPISRHDEDEDMEQEEMVAMTRQEDNKLESKKSPLHRRKLRAAQQSFRTLKAQARTHAGNLKGMAKNQAGKLKTKISALSLPRPSMKNWTNSLNRDKKASGEDIFERSRQYVTSSPKAGRREEEMLEPPYLPPRQKQSTLTREDNGIDNNGMVGTGWSEEEIRYADDTPSVMDEDGEREGLRSGMVIDEIDSDEFFLRAKGISQDDGEIELDLVDDLISPMDNALEDLGEVVDTPPPPTRPIRTIRREITTYPPPRRRKEKRLGVIQSYQMSHPVNEAVHPADDSTTTWPLAPKRHKRGTLGRGISTWPCKPHRKKKGKTNKDYNSQDMETNQVLDKCILLENMEAVEMGNLENVEPEAVEVENVLKVERVESENVLEAERGEVERVEAESVLEAERVEAESVLEAERVEVENVLEVNRLIEREQCILLEESQQLVAPIPNPRKKKDTDSWKKHQLPPVVEDDEGYATIGKKETTPAPPTPTTPVPPYAYFFTLPARTPRTYRITPPTRPVRNYSTLPPSRPARNYSTLRPSRPSRRGRRKKRNGKDRPLSSDVSVLLSDQPEHVAAEDIMRGRPLPPPPRPTRKKESVVESPNQQQEDADDKVNNNVEVLVEEEIKCDIKEDMGEQKGERIEQKVKESEILEDFIKEEAMFEEEIESLPLPDEPQHGWLHKQHLTRSSTERHPDSPILPDKKHLNIPVEEVSIATQTDPLPDDMLLFLDDDVCIPTESTSQQTMEGWRIERPTVEATPFVPQLPQKMHMEELEVDRLSVTELRAGRLLVSDIDAVTVHTSEITSQTGKVETIDVSAITSQQLISKEIVAPTIPVEVNVNIPDIPPVVVQIEQPVVPPPSEPTIQPPVQLPIQPPPVQTVDASTHVEESTLVELAPITQQTSVTQSESQVASKPSTSEQSYFSPHMRSESPSSSAVEMLVASQLASQMQMLSHIYQQVQNLTEDAHRECWVPPPPPPVPQRTKKEQQETEAIAEDVPCTMVTPPTPPPIIPTPVMPQVVVVEEEAQGIGELSVLLGRALVRSISTAAQTSWAFAADSLNDEDARAKLQLALCVALVVLATILLFVGGSPAPIRWELHRPS